MKYKSASSPRYVDAGQTGIALDVVFILQEGKPEVPAVPEVPGVPGTPSIPPVFDEKGDVVTPGVSGTPGTPGQPAIPAIPAIPEVLSDPWPFFATPTDVEAHGRELYAKAVAGDFGPVAAYLPPPPPPVIIPASITRRQCALQLLADGLVTEAEAVAMAATATPPAYVNTLFAGLSAMDRTRALIDFAANAYDRANPLIVGMMTAVGKTPADADAFFVAAAKL
jgi:hypothetical protein